MYPRHALLIPRQTFGPLPRAPSPSLHHSWPFLGQLTSSNPLVGYIWTRVFGTPPQPLYLGWSSDLLWPTECGGNDMRQVPKPRPQEVLQSLPSPSRNPEITMMWSRPGWKSTGTARPTALAEQLPFTLAEYGHTFGPLGSQWAHQDNPGLASFLRSPGQQPAFCLQR